MQEELISVIIPVYNVEDYLERCLKTVLAQTYENLEILLIDDGSTDGSGRICDEASEKDTRIRVWHTENQGPSAARNLGLDHVQGQYLLFADGDDILSVEYVSFLYEQLQKSKADIAVCRYVATKDGAFEETNGTKQLVWFGKEALENLLYQKYYTTGPVCKLFCREVFDGIRFPLGTLYEDTLAIAMAMGKARQVVYSDAIKYGYYQRAGSTMRSTYQEETWQYIADGIHYEHISGAAAGGGIALCVGQSVCVDKNAGRKIPRERTANPDESEKIPGPGSAGPAGARI